MRARRLVLITLIIASLSGCAVGYWADRAADLTDVAHVDLTGWSLGLAANVGPAIAGAHGISGPDGDGLRFKLGLGGIETSKTSGGQTGLVFPFTKYRSTTRGDKVYGTTGPGLGSVGFDLGAFYGVGAHVDVVELLDFLLGLAGCDILDDDLREGQSEHEQKSDSRECPLPSFGPADEKTPSQ